MKRKLFTLLACGIAAAHMTTAQTVYTEDFEGTTGTALPAGWSQTNAGTGTGVGWTTGTNATLGSSSFPLEPHTRFVGLNDDAAQTADNTNSFLKSSSFSLSGVTGAYLSFDLTYFAGSYQGSAETLKLEVSTDGGTSWNVLQTIAGNTVSNWETRYVSLAAYNGMSNLMIGFRYSDAAAWLFGAGIDNFKVAVPPANDLQLTSITPAAGSPASYGTAGTNVTIAGTVFNGGSSTVTAYTVYYQVGANPAVSYNVTGANIAPFSNGTFTHATPYSIPATGNYPINVWVSLTGDEVAANDSATTAVTGVSFMPAKKILAEEGTGTWCGYCVRGIVFMDSIRNAHPDNFSLIAVHNADPMTVGTYDSWMGTQIGGYPSMVIDRVNTAADPSDLFTVYNTYKDNFAFANIALGAATVAGGTYTLPVAVTPAIDLAGDYRLVLVLTEDNVSGTVSGWEQHNYYSNSAGGSDAGDLHSSEYDFNALPGTIPGSQMSYDFVARSVTPSPTGTPNMLPTTMTAGQSYSYTFTTPVVSTWNQNNMKAVVMLLRGSDNAALNTNNSSLPLGVANIAASINGLSVYPNPARDQATLRIDLKAATTLSVAVLDAMGRVVYNIDGGHAAAGMSSFTIPTANLAAGLYTIKVQTATGNVTQPLSVVK